MLAVLELGTEINIQNPCLFVKITVNNGSGQEKVFDTPAKTVTKPSWISEMNPNGLIFNLGNFLRENIESTIKFQIFNKTFIDRTTTQRNG